MIINHRGGGFPADDIVGTSDRVVHDEKPYLFKDPEIK